MAQFIVRQLDEQTKVRLKKRAARHGRSMEAEVREILRNVVKAESRPAGLLGSRITARFRAVGLTSELPEIHGEKPEAAEFGQ